MKKCPQCKASLSEEAKFCHKCGAKIESQPKPGPSTSTSPPAKPDKEPKKSNRKLLWIIVAVLVVIIGASAAVWIIFRKSDEIVSHNENANVNTNLNVNTNVNQNVNAKLNQNVNEPQEERVNPLRSPRDETIVTASSTLVDNTGIGFDYSPAQVLDQDFSTAWVEDVEDEGVGEWIKMEFPGTVEINTLGLVPGFARDNDIYLENNRLKSFELEFSDGTKLTKELPDNYGMHFVEFSTIKTTFLKLTIKEVYEGTKYDDTCLAEMDIWSDYVLNKDAQAALDYYKTYKEASALKPPEKYIEKVYMAIGIMGSPTPEIPVSSYTPAMEPFIAAAEIPASTPPGKTFTAKWYQEGNLFHSEDITSYPDVGQNKITISSTAHVVDLFDPPNVIWPLGHYKVEWYEDGKLSQTAEFTVSPQ